MNKGQGQGIVSQINIWSKENNLHVIIWLLNFAYNEFFILICSEHYYSLFILYIIIWISATPLLTSNQTDICYLHMPMMNLMVCAFYVI